MGGMIQIVKTALWYESRNLVQWAWHHKSELLLSSEKSPQSMFEVYNPEPAFVELPQPTEKAALPQEDSS